MRQPSARPQFVSTLCIHLQKETRNVSKRVKKRHIKCIRVKVNNRTARFGERFTLVVHCGILLSKPEPFPCATHARSTQRPPVSHNLYLYTQQETAGEKKRRERTSRREMGRQKTDCPDYVVSKTW